MLQFRDEILLSLQCLLPHFFVAVIYCVVSLPVTVSALSSCFICVFIHKLIHFSSGLPFLCLTIRQEKHKVSPIIAPDPSQHLFEVASPCTDCV